MEVIELKHPLVEHKLAILRDKKTGTKEFREIVSELATMLCYEAMKDAKMEEVEIETPIQKMKTRKINEDNYAFVPILRAGTGMLDGIIQVVPNAKIGHIGMYRDEETLIPHEYYAKFPMGLESAKVIVLDPMLATGGSADMAIQNIKDRGAKDIELVCLVGAPEGVKYIEEHHPDVKLTLAALDEKLNNKGYIVPGLGDAGDRLFGTN